MNAFMVALLIGFFGGMVNLLVDIPAIWNYNWDNGAPSYEDLINSPHRYLHTPLFCFLVTCVVWFCFITFVYGFCMG